jgi:two-component system, cell cycle sensor histidine kinase and response regulator CckA
MKKNPFEAEIFPHIFTSRPPEDRPVGEGETILVVDDEPLVLDNARRVLERFNYKVLTADSGIAAVSTFRRHRNRIKLVVVDIVMPDMNGAALLHVLRIFTPGLKAVAMSGYAPSSPEIDLLHEDQQHFLAKPFTTSELLCMIRNTLDEWPARPDDSLHAALSISRSN